MNNVIGLNTFTCFLNTFTIGVLESGRKKCGILNNIKGQIILNEREIQCENVNILVIFFLEKKTIKSSNRKVNKSEPQVQKTVVRIFERIGNLRSFQ